MIAGAEALSPMRLEKWMNLLTWPGCRRTLGMMFAFGLLSYSRAAAQKPEGAAIYKNQCAVCHENSAVTRAPSAEALRLMSSENILRALESGGMKDQGSLL